MNNQQPGRRNPAVMSFYYPAGSGIPGQEKPTAAMYGGLYAQQSGMPPGGPSGLRATPPSAYTHSPQAFGASQPMGGSPYPPTSSPYSPSGLGSAYGAPPSMYQQAIPAYPQATLASQYQNAALQSMRVPPATTAQAYLGSSPHTVPAGGAGLYGAAPGHAGLYSGFGTSVGGQMYAPSMPGYPTPGSMGNPLSSYQMTGASPMGPSAAQLGMSAATGQNPYPGGSMYSRPIP